MNVDVINVINLQNIENSRKKNPFSSILSHDHSGEISNIFFNPTIVLHFFNLFTEKKNHIKSLVI